jgi:hypothetical protein
MIILLFAGLGLSAQEIVSTPQGPYLFLVMETDQDGLTYDQMVQKIGPLDEIEQQAPARPVVQAILDYAKQTYTWHNWIGVGFAPAINPAWIYLMIIDRDGSTYTVYRNAFDAD